MKTPHSRALFGICVAALVWMPACADKPLGSEDAGADASVTPVLDGGVDVRADDAPMAGDAGADTSEGMDAGPLGDCVGIARWTESSPFASGEQQAHPLPTFLAQGYLYVHTQGPEGRLLRSAAVTPEGLGPWRDASQDHGGGPHGFDAIAFGDAALHFRNGHIARYELQDGIMIGDVTLLEESVDEAFDGNRYVWDSAVVAHWATHEEVLHLGGFSFDGYEYRPEVMRSGLELASRFIGAGVDSAFDRPGPAAFVGTSGDAGLVLMAEVDGTRLAVAAVTPDSFGEWSEAPALPIGGRGALTTVGRTVIIVRGRTVLGIDVIDGRLSAPRQLSELPAEAVVVGWGDGHLEGGGVESDGESLYVTGEHRVFVGGVVPRMCAL